MKKDYTDITVVLDKSGSMKLIDADTVGSLNSFINDQAKLDGKCTITLVQFAGLTETTYERVDAKNVEPLVLNESYVANGYSTSLHDAIGKTINMVGKKYALMDLGERPEKVVFVIFTDGQENSSTQFTYSKIAEMIKHQENTYKWEFIFLGANQDAIATGAKLGIKADNSLSFAYSGKGITMANASLNSKLTSYRSCGAMSAFTDEDRAEQRNEGSV